MRRREFIALLSAAAITGSARVAAQETGRIYRIGFLTGNAREEPVNSALFDELRGMGFVEGQNLSVVPGGFRLRDEQLAEAAAALVKSAPDAIVTAGPIATRAAQAATKTIAIVGSADDMVQAGLVSSMRHPGSNTTGVSLLAGELNGKRQDLLIEAIPRIRRLAALADPNVATSQHLQALKDGARARGVELLAFVASTREAIIPALDEASGSGAEAINVLATPLFYFNRQIMLERVAALRLPAMYQWAEMAEEGGFAGYGPRLTQWYRQLARLLAQVLRGAHPGDLPIEQPTRFELVLNLQTAKTIGRDIPAELVARADKLIE